MTLVKHCDGGCCDPDGLYRITHYAHNHRHLPPPRSLDARRADRSGSQAGPPDEDIPNIVPISLSGIREASARARVAVYIRRRKKRQKNSETNTSRERNVAVRSETLLLCFCLFLPLPLLLSVYLSFSLVSQSVSQSLLSLLSFSIYLSLFKSSPGGFPRRFRAADTTDDGREPRRESTLSRRLLLPGADCSPTLVRARPEERNCPDRITPRLPSSTYAGSLEYENILRSLS